MRTKVCLFLFFACLFGIVACYVAYADEHHMQPTESFADCLNALPNGGTIYLQGSIDTYEQKIKIQNRHYSPSSPLIVDGQWKTISFQPVDFIDCSYVTVKRMEIRGGVGWNNTKADYSTCLSNVTLENCLLRYGRSFSGGYTFHDLTMIDCRIQEILYTGNETHGVYWSGGHWTGGAGLPHPHDIKVINCEFRTCGGRHGMQVNGCFDKVKVIGCSFMGCALTGFQGIGVQDCEVTQCEFSIANRGCMNIYDYNDQLNPGAPSGYVQVWQQVHHPNDKWHIHHNTFVVPETEWCLWQNPSYVKNRPCILINNELAGKSYQCVDGPIIDLNYEPTIHYIHDNVMVSPWRNILQFDDPYSLSVTHCKDNMIYSKDKPSLMTIDTDCRNQIAAYLEIDPSKVSMAYPFGELETKYPHLYSGNVLDINPQFKRWPEFPPASTIPPMNGLFPPEASFDWSLWETGGEQPNGVTYPPARWNLFSGPATKMKKGVTHNAIWTRGGLIETKKPKIFDFGKERMKPENGTPVPMTPEELKKLIEGGK